MSAVSDDTLHPSWAAILTDPVRLSILRGLCRLGESTTAELQTLCHTSDPTLRRHLEALAALEIVRQVPGESDGLTPGRPARRFRIDPDAVVRLCALFELLREPLVPTPAPGWQPAGDR